jgi:hypothetical protein
MPASILGWSACRCCTTRNAIPVSAGRSENGSAIASRPPAEAPIPTSAAGKAVAEMIPPPSPPGLKASAERRQRARWACPLPSSLAYILFYARFAYARDGEL